MGKVNLSEAFKQLEILNEENFELDNNQDINELKSFLDNDSKVELLDIIDPEAETEEELEDSYIGKVILDCCVCHSKIYKDATEVNIDDETQLANVGEECPYCYTNDGYKIIGQVAPFVPEDDVKISIEDKEDIEEPKADDTLDNKKITESVKKKNKLKESYEKAMSSMSEESTKLAPDADRLRWLITKNLKNMFYQIPNVDSCNYDDGSMRAWFHLYSPECKDVLARTIKSWLKDSDLDLSNYNVYVDRDKVIGWSSHDDRGYDYTVALSKKAEDNLKESYDVGDHIKIINMEGEPQYAGKEGVVDYIDDIGQLHGTWGGCALIPDVDEFTKVNNESLEKVELETEDQKIKIETQPKDPVPGVEMVAPISPDTQDTIENSDELEEPSFEDNTEETDEPLENADQEDVNFDVDDFDEGAFNELGESYLTKVYDNVKGFKTTSVSERNNKLVVEGVINFTSGKQKTTSFIFEAKDATRSGKVRFKGLNEQISRGKKSFTLTGNIKNKKFISESLNYNYRGKDNKGSSARVYGTVKVSK